MNPFQQIELRTSYEQRKRFFASALWKDIEKTIENYRQRELEAMAAPWDFGEDETSVERFRGRIEVLKGICATLHLCMFDDIEEQLNEGEDDGKTSRSE